MEINTDEIGDCDDENDQDYKYVEIRKFHSDSTKNTSLGNHFRFVIFSLFYFVSVKNA